MFKRMLSLFPIVSVKLMTKVIVLIFLKSTNKSQSGCVWFWTSSRVQRIGEINELLISKRSCTHHVVQRIEGFNPAQAC